MDETGPLIRNVSDTALWVAVYRAREAERADALFRDPFARRLAGARGEQIAASIPFSDKATWAWVARTVLFDRFIEEQVRAGVDLVVNLAAGLDARPYRMTLPPALKWVEVDLPGILAHKEEILKGETPVCALERVRSTCRTCRRAAPSSTGSAGARAAPSSSRRASSSTSRPTTSAPSPGTSRRPRASGAGSRISPRPAS